MNLLRRHKHDHQATAVQHVGPVALFGISADTTTVVLRHCACGDVDTMAIPGRWTLAQIRNEQEAADGE